MPTAPRTLSLLRQKTVNALVGMLIAEHKMKRPPEKAAKLLAYLVILHKQGRPFPPRIEVAELLGISIPTIDTALSAQLQYGTIKLEVRAIEGNARDRTSSIRERYYIPSPDV